jgi:hypothetical protein
LAPILLGSVSGTPAALHSSSPGISQGTMDSTDVSQVADSTGIQSAASLLVRILATTIASPTLSPTTVHCYS